MDTGRRRRWFGDEKLKIVLESLQASPQQRGDMEFRVHRCCNGDARFGRSRGGPPIISSAKHSLDPATGTDREIAAYRPKKEAVSKGHGKFQGG